MRDGVQRVVRDEKDLYRKLGGARDSNKQYDETS